MRGRGWIILGLSLMATPLRAESLDPECEWSLLPAEIVQMRLSEKMGKSLQQTFEVMPWDFEFKIELMFPVNSTPSEKFLKLAKQEQVALEKSGVTDGFAVYHAVGALRSLRKLIWYADRAELSAPEGEKRESSPNSLNEDSYENQIQVKLEDGTMTTRGVIQYIGMPPAYLSESPVWILYEAVQTKLNAYAGGQQVQTFLLRELRQYFQELASSSSGIPAEAVGLVAMIDDAFRFNRIDFETLPNVANLMLFSDQMAFYFWFTKRLQAVLDGYELTPQALFQSSGIPIDAEGADLIFLETLIDAKIASLEAMKSVVPKGVQELYFRTERPRAEVQEPDPWESPSEPADFAGADPKEVLEKEPRDLEHSPLWIFREAFGERFVGLRERPRYFGFNEIFGGLLRAHLRRVLKTRLGETDSIRIRIGPDVRSMPAGMIGEEWAKSISLQSNLNYQMHALRSAFLLLGEGEATQGAIRDAALGRLFGFKREELAMIDEGIRSELLSSAREAAIEAHSRLSEIYSASLMEIHFGDLDI